MIAPVQGRSTRHSRSRQSNHLSLSVLPLLHVACVIFVQTAVAEPAGAHDLERTQVSLTFARDGSFVLDVTNDLNWLKLRLQPFARGRHDLAALAEVFVDRVVLFVDGHEVRPTSAELLAPMPHAAAVGAPTLAAYRLRGRMPAGARTLRWYYGLVIDPYPLVLHRADGRTISEVVYGDAWSRTLDIGGQFDDRVWMPAPVARQLPIAIMLGVFGMALGYRIVRRGAPQTN
jgi:hypothetical protein